MATQLSNGAEPSLSSRITSFLANPAVDKTIAVIASLPFLYLLYLRLHGGTLNLARINLAIQYLLLVVTMLVRRTPVRVTTNPWFWLLAFVATYWPLLTASVITPGTAIVPRWWIFIYPELIIFHLPVLLRFVPYCLLTADSSAALGFRRPL